MSGRHGARLAIGLLLAVGCRSDRASDGTRGDSDAQSVAEDDSRANVPTWSPVPSESERRTGVWAVAQRGGADALDRMLAEVRRPEASASELGAVSFLEPPAAAPTEPPAPTGPWAELENALWTRYAISDDLAEARSLLLAIARVGGARSMNGLAADAEVLPPQRELPRYESSLEAMAILCARGFALPRAGLRVVAEGLSAEAKPLRTAAARALARCAAVSAEQIAGEERRELVDRLAPSTGSDEPELARVAYRALAAIGEIPADVDPSILGPRPPAWRVEVEAVRAVVGHADGRKILVERLVAMQPEAIDPTRIHVVLEVLRGLRDAVAGSDELPGRLEAFAKTMSMHAAVAKGRARKRLALVECELAVLWAIADGRLERVERCGDGVDGLPGWYGRALGVEALLDASAALSREDRLQELLQRTEDPAPQVSARALSALADVDGDAIAPALRDALARDDVGVAAAAASAIAARSVDASRRDPRAASELLEAMDRWDDAAHIEARLSAIEALGSLARSATKSAEVQAARQRLRTAVVPLASDANDAVRRVAREALLGHPQLLRRFDEAAPSAPRPRPRIEAALQSPEASSSTGLRVRTDAGEFTIDFRGSPASTMRAVLSDLAIDGFYDGLTIHRVVPGFVVQGGDPHGDGYGGPGFLVPCERSTIRYERGTVGIALAGKDTGGSQFFVTQARQPHLDARYPVVGRVTHGLDVIDRLLPHDRIDSVSVVTP